MKWLHFILQLSSRTPWGLANLVLHSLPANYGGLQAQTKFSSLMVSFRTQTFTLIWNLLSTAASEKIWQWTRSRTISSCMYLHMYTHNTHTQEIEPLLLNFYQYKMKLISHTGHDYVTRNMKHPPQAYETPENCWMYVREHSPPASEGLCCIMRLKLPCPPFVSALSSFLLHPWDSGSTWEREIGRGPSGSSLPPLGSLWNHIQKEQDASLRGTLSSTRVSF